MPHNTLLKSIFPFLLAGIVSLSGGCDTNAPTADSHQEDGHEGHDDHEGHGEDGHLDHDHDGDGIPDHGPDEHGDHDASDAMKPSDLGLNIDELPSSGEASKPETFEQAIEQVGDLVKVIREGLRDGDAESVHMELHDIGDALTSAENLAKETKQDQAVLSAIDSLFDSFGAIDQTLHGEKGKEYLEVEQDIATAMKTLQDSQGN